MIRFGSWSTTLGLAMAFGLTVAIMLSLRGGYPKANRILAVLLIATSLKLTPYVLGYAGFYERMPWLSFAPFDFGLGIGPLLYLYVWALTRRGLPRRWPLHFAPLVIDLAYTCWAFALPLAAKNRWNELVHAPIIDPMESGAYLLSLTVYLALAWRTLGPARSSATDRRRRRWLITMLAVLSAWLVVAIAFHVADLSLGLDYYDRFPEYLCFAAIVIVLGLEGWRHADTAAEVASRHDWEQLGLEWRAAIERGRWWSEPRLTLSDAARRLGTNDSYLSRAFNEGLGTNFASVINSMRIAAVQAWMRDGRDDDLLSLALEAGFASKPSFNRVFRDSAGTTPSKWRRENVSKSRNPAVETTPDG